MSYAMKYNLCRLCLCRGGSLKDIGEECGNLDSAVEETIEDLLHIRVTIEASVPWNVCHVCLEKLSDFHQFKRRCAECLETFESRLYQDQWSQNSTHKQSRDGKGEDSNELRRVKIGAEQQCNGHSADDWSIVIVKDEEEVMTEGNSRDDEEVHGDHMASEVRSEEDEVMALDAGAVSDGSSAGLNDSVSIDVTDPGGGTCFRFWPPDVPDPLAGDMSEDESEGAGGVSGVSADCYEDEGEATREAMFSMELFGGVDSDEDTNLPSSKGQGVDSSAEGVAGASKPRGRVRLTPQLRAQMVAMVLSGRSIASVSRHMGVSRGCVLKWVKRAKMGEWELKSRRSAGRPRCTSVEVDEAIRQGKGRRVEKLAQELGCTEATLRHRLQEMGGRRYLAPRKKSLTKEEKLSRLQFARQYVDLDESYWDVAIFSGIKTFSVHPCGRIALNRPRRTRAEPQHSKEGKELGQVVMSFWGAMSSAGIGPLVRIPPTMRSSDYVEVLETQLVPYADEVVPCGEEVVFVNERHSMRNSQLCHRFFQGSDGGRFEVLTWPADSADLNPLEEVWGTMCRRWSGVSDGSEEDLEIHVRAVWEHVRRKPEMCEEFVGNFRKRLREVVELEGDALLLTL